MDDLTTAEHFHPLFKITGDATDGFPRNAAVAMAGYEAAGADKVWVLVEPGLVADATRVYVGAGLRGPAGNVLFEIEVARATVTQVVDLVKAIALFICEVPPANGVLDLFIDDTGLGLALTSALTEQGVAWSPPDTSLAPIEADLVARLGGFVDAAQRGGAHGVTRVAVLRAAVEAFLDATDSAVQGD